MKALLVFLMLAVPVSGGEYRSESLPPLPDSLGVAGPFAGVSGGALLVGGGANFPDKKPWEGGVKVWHDRIFVLEKPDGVWRVAGKLPRPLGYGASISTPDGVLCIGGSDARRHHSECFLLPWNNGALKTKKMPPLPQTCANLCGVKLGSTVYVAGGLESPTNDKAMKNFWSLDLNHIEAGWQVLEPWPGPERMLAVASAQEGKIFMVSGVKLIAGPEGRPVREYLRDAYSFQPGSGWRRLADLPHPVAGAPSPAPAIGRTHFLVFGGDDGAKVNFEPPSEHPGFSRTILAYYSEKNTWGELGTLPWAAVTMPAVVWKERIILPSGELRPGIRTPKVTAILPP